jgi:hypothetical protein
LVAAVLAGLALGGPEAGDPAGDAALLPDVPGFTPQGDARRFDADSLYEYVNGDAFTYLGFHFEELTTQEYVGEGKQSVTVDLFRHRNGNSGFGIYSYERSGEGEFLDLGGEGYYEGGALNFFEGPYYVKISGTGLGGDAKRTLSGFASRISAAIDGEGRLPAAVAAFPHSGLERRSVRYLAGDVLGHGFLHSAFVADYTIGGDELRAFILEPDDPALAKIMLDSYLAFLAKRGVEPAVEDGLYRFQDPYHAARGLLRMQMVGDRLVATLGGEAAVARKLLAGIKDNLDRQSGS